MTLVLSETDVSRLVEMDEVVEAVQKAFESQSRNAVDNAPRNRSSSPGSTLSVMHASLPYLGRAGVKCYLGSRSGTRFVFVLFNSGDSAPLAVMGADVLGRYRTGAASAVATRALCSEREVTLALFGSGKQALTQVTALASVKSLSAVHVWSPDKEHARSLAEVLASLGFSTSTSATPKEACRGAQIGSAITSSKEPFLGRQEVEGLLHLNICGSNQPTRAEVTPEAVSMFGTVVVDDLKQAREESGDLIMAAASSRFNWDDAVDLHDVLGRRPASGGRTLFKSLGVALEDVAAGSLIYDKAIKSGSIGTQIDLGWPDRG